MTDLSQVPTRLLDDASLDAGLRGDLDIAAQHAAVYDVSAGLARFESTLAAGATAPTAGSGLVARALGWFVGASVLVGGSIGATQLVAHSQTQRTHEGIVVQTPTTPRDQQTRAQAGEVNLASPVGAATPAGAEVPAAAPSDSVAVAAPQSEHAGHAAAQVGEQAGGKNSNDGAASPRPSSSPAADAEGSLADEARQINAARRALATDPAKTLAITQQAAKAFPKGAMVQEREGYAILALAALGREGEANTRAHAYLERWPKGPLSSRVEALRLP